MSNLFQGIRGEFDCEPKIIKRIEEYPSLKKGTTIISKVDNKYPCFEYKKGDSFKVEFAGFGEFELLGATFEGYAIIFLDKNGKKKHNNLLGFENFWEKEDIMAIKDENG